MTDTSANDDAGDFGDTPAHPGDDALLGELQSSITHYDPPPPHLVDGVKAAFGLRRVDEELAQLVADIELAVVRSTPVVTSFAFVSGDASIELDVDDGRLVGELVPGDSVNVTIETAELSMSSEFLVSRSIVKLLAPSSHATSMAPVTSSPPAGIQKPS